MLSSAANVMRVLEYLVDQGEAGVSDIGRHIGVTAGTAHRLVVTLVETGFAIQNPENRRYRPSAKVARLAHEVRTTTDVREVLHMHLESLAALVHETVNLGVIDGSMMLYVDKVMSDQLFGVEARVGARLPAHETALGNAVLAFSTPKVVTQTLRGLASTTGGEQPDRADIQARLKEIASVGYAEDLGQVFSDVYCVAAPILAGDECAIGAISVSVPRSRFDAVRERLQKEVKLTARDASRDVTDLGLTAIPRPVG
jgi:DNA-binding IclR family transcriptional regulator